MATVTIFCDQRFLKPVSEIARVLRERANFDQLSAERISIDCAGDRPVSIELPDDETARVVAQELSDIDTVKAVASGT